LSLCLGHGQTVLWRTPTYDKFVECWIEVIIWNVFPPEDRCVLLQYYCRIHAHLWFVYGSCQITKKSQEKKTYYVSLVVL
jgi:hypothetical protein